MKREVKSVRNYVHPNANGSGGRNMLLLSCGHITSRPASRGVPKTIKCLDCQAWVNNSQRTVTVTLADGSGTIVETWDNETQLPKWVKTDAEGNETILPNEEEFLDLMYS